ncbi:MAG TPA: thiol:disulfide interchange protein DsbA/DsbL [Burkholderiales bacterium]|nr:thiol:disulfide interchange protein DsbA/DsbL [Burkholderiales bacterium]
MRNLTRREFGTLAISLAALGAAPASAQQGVPRPKFEYLPIDPQPVTTGNSIEVVEFFWYGCPYCYQLQQPLEAWLKRKPADVEFRRIPAIFRDSWVPHARVYYTLESLGELGRLHQLVFRSMHLDKDPLNTANVTADWAARNGVDPTRWLTAYNSPEVERKVQEARNHTKAYAITGTPSLIVDGRYLTSSAMSENIPGVVGILEGLIVIARDRRTTAK